MGIGPLVAWRRASLRSLGRGRSPGRPGRARRRRRADRPRGGLVAPGADRVHVLGLRARVDRARVRARDARAAGSQQLELAGGLRRARRAATGAATAATSSTRRSSCWRSASPARARTRPSASASSDPGQSMKVAGYTLTYRGLDTAPPAITRELRASIASTAAATTWVASGRARTSTSPSSRPRTRWRSAPTG